jgi:hypothetical protein
MKGKKKKRIGRVGFKKAVSLRADVGVTTVER